jgi:general L-amino acid transport system permease protein
VTQSIKSAAPAKPPFWRDPEKRALVFQGLFLVVVGLILYTLVHNTMANLERQGIASGFGFLNDSAGFAIKESLIEFNQSSTFFDSFVVGLLNTIKVSVLGVFFATILGFTVGVARLSKNWLIARLAAVYVDTLRNVPLLLQMFFWYFAILSPLPDPKEALGWSGLTFLSNRGLYTPKPIFEDGFGFVIAAFFLAIAAIVVVRIWAKKRQAKTGQQFPVLLTSLGLIIGLPLLAVVATGFPLSWELPVFKGFNFKGGLVVSPEFASLVFALSIYTSSFIAEIVRAGIQSVPHGQTEAAFSLGIKPSWTTRLIILPQSLRVIIPPLTSQYLNLTKNSSLAVAIGYPDLVNVFAGTALSQVGQAVEIMGMTLAVYLFLSLVISSLMNFYNNRKALIER